MKIKVKAKFEISKKEMKEVMKMINELEKMSVFGQFINNRRNRHNENRKHINRNDR